MTLLSGGTFLGQAILMLSSPLLTRLYTPAEFGALAVFTALASMLIVGMALRYEFAVPVCRDEEDALGMVAVSAIAVTALALLLGLLVLALGDPLARLLGLHGHPGLLWLLPPVLWLWGLTLPLSGWSIRRGSFRLQAAGNVAQFAAQASAQLGLGVLGVGGGGLVVGYSLGPVARLAFLLRALGAEDRRRLRRLPLARLRALARAHWRYPVFSSSSSVLQSASQMLPAVLVAALYGPAAAGLFGLTQRVLGAPVRMLGEAASQVFLGEIARLEGAALHRLFRRTALLFLAAGLVGATPFLLAGPGLFALVFGESWREAGTLVQLLVPLYVARFIVVPVSQTLNVTGRQHLHLTASTLNVLALAGSFGAGAALALPMTTTVLLYSAGSTAAFLFYLAAAWRAARLAARAPAPPAPPEA
jgi:O-antigen/teichoic acid export membrane protein